MRLHRIGIKCELEDVCLFGPHPPILTNENNPFLNSYLIARLKPRRIILVGFDASILFSLDPYLSKLVCNAFELPDTEVRLNLIYFFCFFPTCFSNAQFAYMHRRHADALNFPVILDPMRRLAGGEFDRHFAVTADCVQHLVVDEESRLAGIARVKRAHLKADFVGLARCETRNIAPDRPARRERHVDAGMSRAEVGATGRFDSLVTSLPSLGRLEILRKNHVPARRRVGKGCRHGRCWFRLGCFCRRGRRRRRHARDFLLVEFVKCARLALFGRLVAELGILCHIA